MADNAKIMKLRNRALAVARAAGAKLEDAEDFAQYATIKVFVKDKGHKQGLGLMYVDFKRNQGGRIGGEKGTEKGAWLLRNPLPAGCNSDILAEIEGVAMRMPTKVLLTDQERKIFFMIAGGFSFEEVGKVFELTQSRISQIVSDIKEKILS